MVRTAAKTSHNKNVPELGKKVILSAAKKTISASQGKKKNIKTETNDKSPEITQDLIEFASINDKTKSPIKNVILEKSKTSIKGNKITQKKNKKKSPKKSNNATPIKSINIKLNDNQIISNKINPITSNKNNITSTLSNNISKSISSTVSNNTMNRSRRKHQPQQLYKLKHSHIYRPFLLTANMYKEIRRLQLSTKKVIPKSPLLRLVKEILFQYCSSDMRIQRVALIALQESCELYMTQFFEDSYLATLHAKRVTLFPEDMRLVRRLRGISDICNRQ